MAEVRISNMPWPSIRTCRRSQSCRWRKTVPLRCVIKSISGIHDSRAYVGGEFSSLHQNNFHHYRDFWEFEISSHSWDRIDTKIRPSGRSGHRYALKSSPSPRQSDYGRQTVWLCGNSTLYFLVVSLILDLRVRVFFFESQNSVLTNFSK